MVNIEALVPPIEARGLEPDFNKSLDASGAHLIFFDGKGGGGSKGKGKKGQVPAAPAATTLFSSNVMTGLLPERLLPGETESKPPTPEAAAYNAQLRAAYEADKPKPVEGSVGEPTEDDYGTMLDARDIPAGKAPRKKGSKKRNTFGGLVGSGSPPEE